MSSIQDIKLEVTDLVTLKFVTQAFTEASAAKLQNIRAAFERNRQFYEEISHVYHLIRLNDPAKAVGETIPKETKTLAVAVTSNQRFYGSLNINIMRALLSDIQTTPMDMLIIGVTGQDYMHSIESDRRYDTFTLAKEYPTHEEARTILEKTMPYGKVFLYYPKFVTLMTQSIAKIDITQAAVESDKTEKEETYILFEPEFSRVREFFQKQVRSLLFLRVMLEADLSRTAARLLTMSAAEERSDELIHEKKAQLRKAIASFINAQLLETFAGMGQWKR